MTLTWMHSHICEFPEIKIYIIINSISYEYKTGRVGAHFMTLIGALRGCTGNGQKTL